MSNDLDLYQGGDLAPYSPGTGLQPYSPAEDWGRTDVDYLSERPTSQPLPQQVEQNIAAIAEVFTNDFANLGYVMADINKIIGWFKQSLVSPVTRMPAKRHSYSMWQFSHDIQFMAFCNWAATQRFPQELIQSVAFWLQELENFQHGVGRFAGQQVSQTAVSSDPADQLTDAQYEQVVIANERAAQATLGRLKDLWGSSYAANMRLVQNHFASLTTAEQDTLSQYTTGFIKGTNTFEILVSLYAEAVQAHTIPRDGASIERELQAITKYMKERRSEYLKDEATQARFRELLNQQSKGY